MRRNIACHIKSSAKMFFSLLFTLCCLLLISCANPFMEPVLGLKTIFFNTNGGSHVQEQRLIKGERVVKPGDPVKEGYFFGGWYEDNDTFELEWNFNAFAGSDLTLHAKWIELPTAEFDSIELKQNPKLAYIHGDSLDLSNLVINFKYDDGSARAVPFGEFAAWGITTSPQNGEELSRSSHNGVAVEISYIGINISTAPLIVNPAPITNAEISIYSPATGEAPDFTAEGKGNFTIDTVKWEPNDNFFLGSTRYTVTIALSVINSNYTFIGLTAAAINGETAVISNNSGEAVALSYQFNPTNAKAVKEMRILTEPESLVFTHGDLLDLTGLVLRLTYNDGEFDDVPAADFGSFNIFTMPENDSPLNYGEDNNKKINIKLGRNEAETSVTLKMSQRLLTVHSITHIKVYDGNKTLTGEINIELDNILEGDEVFCAGITAEYTSADSGTNTVNITSITLGGGGAGNYTVIIPANPFTVIGGIKEDGEKSFVFKIDDILDAVVNVSSGVTLSRSAGEKKEITITGENISSVEWYYGGEEITGSVISNNGKTILLVVSDNPANAAYKSPYNVAGKHLLTVVVTVNNMPYSKKIEFEVVN
jgi:uncharacterized repeat protein (TIGR02543 family)